MKKIKSTYILLGIAAIVLLSSFKKKTTNRIGKVFVDQLNPPSGTTQVYSKVGTKVYDRDFNIVYTYDTANLGMTVTGSGPNNTISIVFGSDFYTGLPAFVFPDEIITI